MKREANGEKLKLTFTLDEFTKYVADYKNPNSEARTYKGTYFCDQTWNESIDLLQRGWAEGIKDIDLTISKIADESFVKENDLVRDVTGDFFDVGLLMTGEPECWFSETQVETPKKELNVVVSCSFSAFATKEQITNRGAVITAFIDRMRKDHFVNLTLSNRVTFESYKTVKYKDLEICVTIDTENFYSRSVLAFIIACPSFLRRIMWGAKERAENHDTCDGYGHPSTSSHTDKDVYFPQLCADTVSEYKTIDSAKRVLENLINRHSARH